MGLITWFEMAAKLEKIVADGKAAEQTPAGQQLIADIEAWIADAKAAQVPVAPTPPAPVPTTEPTQGA